MFLMTSLLLCGSTFAASYAPATWAERVQNAGGVFSGTLQEIQIEERAGKPTTTLIFTEVRWAFGGASDRVEIEHIGGRVGDQISWVSGIPVFEEGFRYLLMLSRGDSLYVPFVAGENGAWQVVESRHGDELLVNAAGEVLLLTGTQKVRTARWFESNAAGEKIAQQAPDFQSALDVETALALASRLGATAVVGVDEPSNPAATAAEGE